MIRIFIVLCYFLCLSHGAFYAQIQDSAGLKFSGHTFSVARIDTIPAYHLDKGDFTLELNFKASPEQSNNKATLLSTRSRPQDDVPYPKGLRIYLNEFNTLYMQTGQQHISISNSNLGDGECHHVAIRRSNGIVESFVDGQKTNITTSKGPLKFMAPFIQLGADISDSTNTKFKGSISSFRFWRTARSTEAIRAKADSIITERKNNLLGYWLLKASEDQSVPDRSPHNNHAYPGIARSEDGYEPEPGNACMFHISPPKISVKGPREVCKGKKVTFHARGGSSFSWYRKQNPEEILSQDSVLSTQFKSSGTLIVRSTGGREQSIDIEIKSREQCHPLEVFELITPNGDKRNDVFYIRNIQHYPDHKVVIFNKAGDKVFQSENYRNNWQGGTLPSGIYYYSVQVPGLQKTFSGQLMIRRE